MLDLEGRSRPEVRAIVTVQRDAVASGIPVFFAADEAQQAEIAADISRVLRADVFKLRNGVYLIVDVVR